jgi:hypothetical protein
VTVHDRAALAAIDRVADPERPRALALAATFAL